MAIRTQSDRILPIDCTDKTVQALIQLSEKAGIPVDRISRRALNRGVLELQRGKLFDDTEAGPVAQAAPPVAPEPATDHGNDDIDPDTLALCQELSLNGQDFLQSAYLEGFSLEAEKAKLLEPIDFVKGY